MKMMYTHLDRFLVYILIILALFFMLGCKPNELPKDIETTININVQLKSNLSGKQIADNTHVVLSDNINRFDSFSKNGNVVFTYSIIKGQTVDFELTASENLGHKSASIAFSTNSNKTITLEMAAKEWITQVSFNTTKETTPIGNIEYTVNPGNITGATDASGNKTIPFTLNTNNYNEPLNTDAAFDFKQSSTTKDMHYDRTIEAEKENNFVFDLTKQTYQHLFTVTTSGNIKTPKLTGSIGTITYDNKTENFDPATGTISFVSDDEVENGIGVKVSNVQGYKDGGITVNNVGSRLKNGETHNIILEGIIYDATQPFIVTDGTNPLGNAKIVYIFGEKTGTLTTTTKGEASVTLTNLESDTNNLPLDEYLLTTITTKAGYPEHNNEFSFTEGINEQASITMGANKFWMKGTVSPTNNVDVKGYKTGKTIFDTKVKNGSYTTDTIPSATEEYKLDSLIFKSEGFIPKKFFYVTLKKNEATTKDATLDLESLTYTVKGTGSPNGANAKVWKEGTALIDVNVADNIYQGSYITTSTTLPVDSIVFTAPGRIKEKLGSQILQKGDNVFNFSLEQEPVTYTVKGTGSPNYAHAKVWKGGAAIIDATVANGTYQGSYISTTNPLPVDSIVFTASGYEKEKLSSRTLQKGDNIFNFSLQEEEQDNTYNIKIETLDDKLDNYITTGTIEITTASDQQRRTIPIDNDGITDLTITGPYEKTENVDIKIYNNSTHTNGTFALLHNGQSAVTGKIGSRINLPGYINHNLTTTLDAIDDPIGTYSSMFSDESKNNSNIMESINEYYTNKGVSIWTPPTVSFINLTRDPTTGEDLTQSRIDRQQEALQFFADRKTTNAGKTLYVLTGITQTPNIPPDPTGNVTMYRNNAINAGNDRLYTSTNRYKAVTASTKDSNTDNMMITELAEGMGINDNSSGNGSFAFTVDGSNKINGFSSAGKTARIAAFTYQPADFKK